ncbi:MAG: glycogen synthase [Proteobacteria bacterium]|nr:glycogen synthase [Pseudomonadota bacterium]
MILASEAVPFIKTGGLGDVAGTLAIEMADAGHKVSLFVPYHKAIKEEIKDPAVAVSNLDVPMGNSILRCQVLEKSDLPNLRCFFIEYETFFDRNPIYDDGDKEYSDNGFRFAFFCKACLEALLALKIKPDLIHCNDWQTALIPYYLKCWGWGHNFFNKTASVLTIHNLGYQGVVDKTLASFIGLNSRQLRSDEFEAFGAINLLKGGLYYADLISTVSPTYAKEILTEPGGSGLSPYIIRREDDVVGILNGIDEEEWNPEKDELLPAKFGLKDLKGKKVCKKALQKRFMLSQRMRIPVFGMIGRMADQKGLDLLQGCIHEILKWDLQLIILGSGDPKLESFFRDLPRHYPDKVGTYIGFETELAHLIEAGSDCFIMPSKYEPCGLNQMYSMRYGTVPIVRGVGGLVDTVANFDASHKKGRGFVFYDASPEALKDTIGWALDTWYNNKRAFKMLQKNGMSADFRWKSATKAYENAYKQALARKGSW